MDTPAPAPMSVPPVFLQPAPRKSPWRWVRRGLLFVVLAVVGTIGAAPTVISKNPELRDNLIRRFMGKLDGDITIKEFSIGWTTPLEIEGFTLLPHASSQPVDGAPAVNQEPLIKIHRVEAERPLWRMLWDRTDVGTIRIERPEVFLALGEKGHSNFEKVFKPILVHDAKPPESLEFGVRAQIVDGTLRGISNETREPWVIPGINLAVGVHSAKVSKSGKPELFIEKGTLVRNGELNAGLCNDVLKFAAPVMAKSARARGTITIEFDDWRLPWKDFKSGEASGRLIMNSVEIGPGTLVESFMDNAGRMDFIGPMVRANPLPKFVTIANDTVVTFKLVEGGRVQHDGLRFSLAGLIDVQTHGTVGFDETLDMEASLGVHPPNPEDRRLAVLRQLTNQRWPVNVHGKLSAPQIDLGPLDIAWKQLLLQKVPADWLSGRSSIGGNTLQALNNSGVLTPELTGWLLTMLQSVAAAPPTSAPPTTQLLDSLPPGGPALGPATGANLGPTPLPSLPTTTIPTPSPVVPPPTGVPPTAAYPIPAPSSTALPGTAPPAFGVADGVKLGLDVLSAIRAHRQQQQRPPLLAPGALPPQPPAPQPPAGIPPPTGVNPPGFGPGGVAGAPAPAAALPPPRRPLLRQGLRLLLDAAAPVAAPSGTSPTGVGPAPVGPPPAAEPPGPAKREP